VQFRLQPFADRLPQHREPPVAPLLHTSKRVSLCSRLPDTRYLVWIDSLSGWDRCADS
jgi:hypothetical protein